MNKTVDFQGRKIAYHVQGAGHAILLLHGFIESKEIWNQFLEKLAPAFTVVAPDLPGHGHSEVISEVHSMELMAGSVKEVMEAEGITEAVFVGHSMGGYVALEFAKLYPEMVAGLVLFHSQAAPDNEEAKENRRRTINIVKQNRAGFIGQFIPDLFAKKNVETHREAIRKMVDVASGMSAESIIAAIEGMRDRKGGLAFLMTTRVPVLFIIGKQDSRIPYNQVLAQAVIPEHSETLMLDEVGHMGYLEAPEKTLPAVKHFAARCYSL